MITITLQNGDREKKFVAPFVSARKLRQTIELSKSMEKASMEGEDIDKLAAYLVDLYGNQFTIDELLDGYPSQEFMLKAVEDMQKVIGDLEGKIKN